ncbi:MAG: ornithine cyclodeaminase family protein [Burkholderiales bacterium]|nr:ornithine cyclodeaminase family protein [Burkholderiales bacterium]
MLTLSQVDIKQIFTMKEAILASKEALAMHTRGKSIVPLRTNINIPNYHGQSLFMPAYSEELDITGVKIVSFFPNNVKTGKPSILGQMILIDGKDGEIFAMIDGTYLTQLRTGALQGAATDLLAKKDAKCALLIGTGGQAATQLEALLNVRDLDEVRVYGINYERTQQFVFKMQEELTQFKTRIIAISNCDKAVKEADIITTITSSKVPVFDGGLVQPGTHINGIGSYTPEMQELPESIIKVADKIFFDTKEGVLVEAGDIIIPLKNRSINKTNFTGDLGELILNIVKGRETNSEITIFKAVGTAVLDLVTAFRIYTKALNHRVK